MNLLERDDMEDLSQQNVNRCNTGSQADCGEKHGRNPTFFTAPTLSEHHHMQQTRNE
jgi:hypothetical protein